nr:hypothetical protein GCM10020092_029150 [Actinoplanes digitatis]
MRTDVTVRYDGRTLYRHELSVGPGAPGWSGGAVLGGGRAVGSVILAGPGAAGPGALDGDGDGPGGPATAGSTVLGGCAVLMPLAGPGMLAGAVGTDIREVRAALDPLCVRRDQAATATAIGTP